MAAHKANPVADLLSTVSSTVGSLLQNPSVEEKEMDSDRVAASTTTNAGNLVQASVAPTMPFKPDFRNKDNFLSMSYTPDTAPTNPTKMVHLVNGTWTTSQHRQALVAQITLPQAFWPNERFPAWGQSRYFAAVRCGFHIQVQLNVNIGSAGCLIAAYMPKSAHDHMSTYTFSSYTNLPHVLMNAATTSQADLYIPYIFNHNYARTDSDDLGGIYIWVWSALTVPSGSPTTVDVTVFGSLLDLDFQCPRPPGSATVIYTQGKQQARKTKATKFKWTRNKIDISEGPGSMNIANVLSTTGGQTVALVGERAFYDPRTAGAAVRCKDLMEIARMPSVFKGERTDPDGTRGYFTWSHTIAPINWVFDSEIHLEDMPNLNVFSACYNYWRGSFVIKLTVYASTFNKGRLRMAFYPNHSGRYTEEEAQNAIFVVCDIGLNNTFEMTIPYTWGNWMRPTRGSVLGHLRIDVLNRLTYNSSSPNAVNCVLQVKMGNDASFMVPTTSNIVWEGLHSWGSEMDLVDSLDNPEEIQHTEEPESSNLEAAQGEEAATAVGLRATENDGSLTEQLNMAQPMFLNFKQHKVNIYAASHTKVDHIFGRAWAVGVFNTEVASIQKFDINFPTTTHGALCRFFCFWTGELNIHILNVSTTNAFLKVAHTWFGTDSGLARTATLESNGVMIVPPNEQMTLTVPYYSEVPLRCVKGTDRNSSGLGSLFTQCVGRTVNNRIQIFVSFRCPNFFFPLPAPHEATSRTVLQRLDEASADELEAVLEARTADAPLRLKFKPEDPLYQLRQAAQAYFNIMHDDEMDYSGGKFLNQCGDVESNPGPDIELVYKSRGFYKHYGVRINGHIYHLNSQDILTTAITGKSEFIKEPDDGNWTHVMTAPLDYFTEKYVNSLVGSKHIFSATTNCETIARELFPGKPEITQSKALGIIGVILLSASLLSLLAVPWDLSSLQTVYNQSIEGDASGLTLLSQRCMTFFSNTMCETFNNDLVKFIIKILVRLLCYIVLYCHAPNMLTTMCLGTLLVLDITTCEILSANTKALFQALMDGDVKSLVWKIAENMQFAQSTDEQAEEMAATFSFAKDMVDIHPMGSQPFENQGWREFNDMSMSFRHIEWWLTMFKKIYNVLKGIFSPSIEQKAVNWLDKNQEYVASVLDHCSDMIIKMKDPKQQRNAKVIEEYFEVLKKMKPLVSLCVKVAPSTKFSAQVFRLYSELMKVNVRVPVNTDLTRMEPIGIWISSEPGQGKSFFTHMLSTSLLKSCNLDGVYTNATGSEFMDGYIGQDIHIIDDAGQNREEKDLALLCQCISSVPFTVPMADLTEKGTFYTSKIVIATTNKSDFTCMVLTDPAALERRFPFNLRIRAVASFMNKDRKLDVPRSMGAMADGSCWECSSDFGRTWHTVSMKDLVKQITDMYKQRDDALTTWKYKLTQIRNEMTPGDSIGRILEPMEETLASLERRFGQLADSLKDNYHKTADELIEIIEDMMAPGNSPFACFENIAPTIKQKTACEKVKAWVKDHMSRWANFVLRNKGWFTLFSVLSSFLSILTLVYLHYKKEKKEEEKQERAYNPQTATSKKGGKPKLSLVKATNFVNEAPYMQDLEHCFAQTAYISSPETTDIIHCAALMEDTILVYGHAQFYFNKYDDLKLHFKGAIFPIEGGRISQVTVNGQPMDLVMIKIDKLPITFKNYTKYYTNEIGKDNLLIWNSEKGRLAMPVECVTAAGPVETVEGTVTHKTYSYKVASKRGMCGGLLVTRINGTFKVLGMHIAGNGHIARSAAVHFITNGAAGFEDQGVVVAKEKNNKPIFLPSKTALNPSPLNGIVPVKMEPAVLSPHDNRLQIQMPSVVKAAAAKYRVNIFDPDFGIWEQVVDEMKTRFRSKLGLHKHTTIQKAVMGFSSLASLDLSTSPGQKYVELGLRKRDLISLDPFWLHPMLEADVKKILGEVYSGQKPLTFFAAHLKDELRKTEKVVLGKTRCIEACSVDYVIAYRVVMSSLYEAIYQTPAQELGLAVGMNPWTDWDPMINVLQKYNYGLDYSSYDGSLSEQLMQYGVDILAYCHEEPEVVKLLHAPVVNSRHLVMDEIWHVQGGMPSGAPCTTVLNSICNLLVCTYLAYEQSLEIEVMPIVYGDDVIFSVSSPLDMDYLVKSAAQTFGMEVTSSDKTGPPKLLEMQEIEFLKRTTKFFPGSTYKVGALNLDTMEQHIMWMRNMDTFPEQLVSFENELVLHGKDVYDDYRMRFNAVLSNWRVCMQDYEVVLHRMLRYVFD
ncbi:polyprotein [Ljunganvirus 5]|uniref:Genome polyprotein n=1 Tax=Ljunganvirus 5 TaxID=2772503 RepID=A0A1B4Z1H7_9PICO|nr:polyprotein [Ljunganvirus 5]